MTAEELRTAMGEDQFIDMLRGVLKDHKLGGWRGTARDIGLVASMLGLIGIGVGVGRESAAMNRIREDFQHADAATSLKCEAQAQVDRTLFDDIKRRLDLLERHVRP